MNTSLSVAFTEDGLMQMRVAGKLTGHAARRGLEILRSAAESGRWKLKFDLRETTSIDSLGLAIFNWIRKQNGNLKIAVVLPVQGVSDEELEYIRQSVPA
ncbi:MAG: hypothetical protein E3J72_19075 [Planctomycetota bacterium]|nr:MAG: hypothetical protein E3J72_19075 [Planctomycetota bacterium]